MEDSDWLVEVLKIMKNLLFSVVFTEEKRKTQPISVPQ